MSRPVDPVTIRSNTRYWLLFLFCFFSSYESADWTVRGRPQWHFHLAEVETTGEDRIIWTNGLWGWVLQGGLWVLQPPTLQLKSILYFYQLIQEWIDFPSITNVQKIWCCFKWDATLIWEYERFTDGLSGYKIYSTTDEGGNYQTTGILILILK